MVVKSPGVSQSLQKGLQILEYIIHARSMTVTSLANRMGIQKSVSHRFLTTLRLTGYIYQDEHNVYRPTDKVQKLAKGIVPEIEMGARARQDLVLLSKAANATANLGLWNGKTISYIAQYSNRPVVLRTVGETVPAYIGAMGKAILAYRSENELQKYLQKTVFTPYTDKTIQDKARFLDEIRTVRRRGYATADGELALGMTSVAMPVFESGAPPRYAVSVVSVTHSHVDILVAEALPHLGVATRKIAAYLEA